MFYVSVIVGKIIISLLRLSGKGGSALPGLIIEKINRNFLNQFGEIFEHNIILVTGTNGKTTTTKVLVEVFTQTGEKVLTNKSGSNFNRGIISSIIEGASWNGRLNFSSAIFEVDEAYAPQVARALNPKQLIALNVFRDQLDRFGELDKTAARIQEAAVYSESVIVNINDPNLAEISKTHKNPFTFGMTGKLQKNLPSDDMFHAKEESLKTIEADLLLKNSQHNGQNQHIEIEYKNENIKLNTKLIGLHNSINITAIVASCIKWGIDIEYIKKVIPHIKPAFGRGEIIEYKDIKILLLLVKNPAGFNQILNMLSADKIAPSIIAINDQIADGRDVSWLWDVDFEKNKSIIKPNIICSGSRGYDMAVRLKYAARHESEVVVNLEKAINKLKSNSSEQYVIVATYTAMLKIREILSRGSNIEEFWK